MRHTPTPNAPYANITGTREELDRLYAEKRLSPPAGRLLHASRVLILAAQSLLPPARSPDPRVGVCLSASNSAGESYTAFQNSLETGKIMPRFYALSVPNAATSELCLKFRIAGPAVTLSDDADSPVTSCPQLALAEDWLASGNVDQVLIGAIDVAAAPLALTRCVALLTDATTVHGLREIEQTVAPAPDAVAFLAQLAVQSELSEAKVA